MNNISNSKKLNNWLGLLHVTGIIGIIGAFQLQKDITFLGFLVLRCTSKSAPVEELTLSNWLAS